MALVKCNIITVRNGVFLMFSMLIMHGMVLSSFAQTFADKDTVGNSVFNMSMDELMNINVVTASNKEEKLNDAPATIIVVTAKQIKERGYFQIYDMLNDLPGFDLSRAFGDDQYYAYVRGYRKTTSDQMLLMIDGIIMNHLYNNNMNAFFQYPMSNVRQVEIAYGPASAIYGPNAFSGVINIITKKSGESTVLLASGTNNSNVLDLYFSEKINQFQINLSGRIYQSDGQMLEGRTSMLQDSLYTNPYYWGDLKGTGYTGFQSTEFSHYLHPSVKFNGLEVGMISFFEESGLGSEFAGGTVLNGLTWQSKENTIYSKFEKQLENWTVKSLFRYRRSDIPGSAGFLWRWLDPGSDTTILLPGQNMVMNGRDTVFNTTAGPVSYVTDRNSMFAEYWQANNASFSFYQDFAYKISNDLDFNFGLKYNRRILNRDYVINRNSVPRDYVYLLSDSGRTNPLNPAVEGSMEFPKRPDDLALDQENHNVLTDRGVYAQLEYRFSKVNMLFGGLRFDYNSVWGKILSPRMGILLRPKKNLNIKAFFGTAFAEPSARILYGGWSGSLSNENLKPEKMRSAELTANYTGDSYNLGLNGFINWVPNAIALDENRIPINIGERRMIGLEGSARWNISTEGKLLSGVSGTFYASYIHSVEDAKKTGVFDITGNMAPIKLRMVITGKIGNKISLSLQNRYISPIKAVSTNPLGTINGHFVTDGFLRFENFGIKGVSVGLKVYNVFNEKYFHPGYRAADADEIGVNHALLNTSWYSSRLPQPLRNFLLTMRLDY